MMTTRTRFLPQNRYSAPLTEKMEDELLLAIRKDQADAEACRAELVARGWKAEWITARTAR